MSKKAEIKLSFDQANALKDISKWLSSGTNQYITLGGYAGTGKTSLLAILRNLLRKKQPSMRIAFAAYTGKASLVLKNYLKKEKILQKTDSVSTLHSLLYYSNSHSDGTFNWTRKDKLIYDLIVVDEASMVSEEIWHDLLSYGKKVIAVGDHGQLPPINSQFNLMNDPQIKLETIWRQSINSPIITLATKARLGEEIKPNAYGLGVRKLEPNEPETNDIVEEILSSHNQETLILCAYNHTRQKLNSQVRSLKGFESQQPQRGDTIVCLRNSVSTGLVNGQLGIIEVIIDAENDPKNQWYYIVADFDGIKVACYAPREQFGATTTLQKVSKRPKGDIVCLFDFGYALTVHKAQGSQAKRVLVFEQRFSRSSEEDWRRWLYTALTRAQEELYIIAEPKTTTSQSTY